LKSVSVSAVGRYAALCGLLVLPGVAQAQLKCLEPTDPEIRSVTFEGNHQFSASELRAHVLAEPTDLVRKIFRRALGTQRCLRPGLLLSDSLRLSAFYRDQGFPNARVRDTAIAAGNHWVDIVFTVREGDPVLVDSVSLVPSDFAGLNLGSDLPKILRLQAGTRYSQAIAAADIDTIEARMRNSGYRQGNACVFAAGDDTTPMSPNCGPPAPKAPRISVRVQVDPGPLVHIGKVFITDTAITGRSAVITDHSVRQLLPFKPGDLYQERLLTQAQRQLYQLGTFYHAAVKDSVNSPTDSVADVYVLVVEEYMRQLTSRSGWGTQDCFYTGGQYTDKAFLHSVNQFEASAQVSKLGWAPPPGVPVVRDLCHGTLAGDEIASTKINYSTTLRFTQPAAFGGLLDRSFAAYSEVRGAYKAYQRTTLIGGAASVSKLLSESATTDQGFKKSLVGLFGYNLEYGHTDAPPAVFCFIFRACNESDRSQLQQNQRLSVVDGVVTRDWRDNSILPTTGTLSRVEGRLSSDLLGSTSSVQFRKGTGDLTWYHPAFKSDVIAIRFRAGVIGGGNSTGGAQFVPPQERLYTGGETSVRGFGTNELGPLIYVVSDTTHPAGDTLDLTKLKIVQRIPTGGNAMLVWNFEYRIRGPFFTNRLQTILFLDAGRLWTPGAADGFNTYQRTPGVAFRVFTPIGPVQFNVAYNGYRDPAGAVFFDQGISSSSTGELICLSNTSTAQPGQCQATFAPPLPKATWKNPFSRLRFSIAFPPDY
jgi:outer membrane protein insertion porin family